MSGIQAVLLGILQGFTEFLPVSSSGHLVLGQHFFGITEPVLAFDISLHVGTLAAVLLVFRSDIAAMLKAMVRVVAPGGGRPGHRAGIWDDPDLRFAAMIVIGSVPTAVIGLVLKKYTDILFSSLVIVGAMLVLTGTLLWFTRKAGDRSPRKPGVGIGQALFVGVCQGMAVMPGISRSGATIAAGMYVGIERETAARFSFLLSVPAILGAELLSLKEMVETTGILIDGPTLMGTLAAFASGWLALVVLLRVVRRGKLHLFAPYCWVVGLGVLAASLF